MRLLNLTQRCREHIEETLLGPTGSASGLEGRLSKAGARRVKAEGSDMDIGLPRKSLQIDQAPR